MVTHIIIFYWMNYFKWGTGNVTSSDEEQEDGNKERLVWIKADHQKKYYPEFLNLKQRFMRKVLEFPQIDEQKLELVQELIDSIAGDMISAVSSAFIAF